MPLQRVFLVGAAEAVAHRGGLGGGMSAALPQSLGVAVPRTFTQVVEGDVAGWAAGHAVLEVSSSVVREVVVPDAVRGGEWHLTHLPLNWERRLGAQALTSLGDS